MLSAEDLVFTYGRLRVLNGMNLTLASDEVLGLGGPSGVGKTTLGRLLAGRLSPQSGRVRLDGAPLPAPAPGRAGPVQYAAQNAELAVDPRWPVHRILANGGPPDGEILQALGVDPAWHPRRPAELSGGELARIALARLFHPGLRALVCDEITAQLDALEQATLLERLLALARKRGIGLVLISHHPGLRARYCDREVLLPGPAG